MSRVEYHGHGVYCYRCQAVYQTSGDCDHDLGDMAGIRKQFGKDYYLAQPADMGHNGPHMFIEVDGMEQCAECNAVKIPQERVE